MNALAALVRVLDRLNEAVGRATSWLTLGTVIVCFVVVVMRYGFGIGFIWMQELYIWFYGLVFTVGAGYTLVHDGHVRVDVFYKHADWRYKAWINLVGSLLFLLPWVAVIVLTGLPYVGASWRVLEASTTPGGMEGLFILKTLMLVAFALLGLQGLAMAARNLLVLAGHPEFIPAEEEHETL